MSSGTFDPQGVIPACLMPFTADLEIDEAAYRRHVSDLAGIAGVTAITVNGHAAEVHALVSSKYFDGAGLDLSTLRCSQHPQIKDPGRSERQETKERARHGHRGGPHREV